MSLTQVLAVRKGGAQLSTEFKEALLNTCNISVGYAAPQEKTRVDTEYWESGDAKLASCIDQVEKEYAQDTTVYWGVGGNIEEMNLDSCQPFTALKDEEQRTILSVFVEGDEFPFTNDDGETFTGEALYFNSVVKPLVDQMWDLASGDMKQFMAFMKKKPQEDILKKSFGPRATVLFVPCTGDIHGVAANNLAADWGAFYATRSLGVAPPAKEVEKKEEPKPAEAKTLSLKERAALAAKGNKPDVAPLPSDNPKKPDEEKKPSGTDYGPLLRNTQVCQFYIKNDGTLMVKPPKDNGGQPTNFKDANQFWNRHTDLDRPPKEDGKAVMAGFPYGDLKPNSSIRDLKAKLMGEEKPSQPKEADADVVDPAKVSPKEVGIAYYLTDDTKTDWRAKKEAGKLPATDLETLTKLAKDYPLASVNLGENWGDIAMLSAEGFNRLHGHLKTMFWHETRIRLLKAEGKIKDLWTAKADVAEPTEKPAETPVTGPNADKPTLSLKERAAQAGKKAA